MAKRRKHSRTAKCKNVSVMGAVKIGNSWFTSSAWKGLEHGAICSTGKSKVFVASSGRRTALRRR